MAKNGCSRDVTVLEYCKNSSIEQLKNRHNPQNPQDMTPSAPS